MKHEETGVIFRLLIIFVGLPLVELMLLHHMSSGSTTQFLAMIVVVVGTGVLGATLARRQGLKAWTRIHQAMAAGRAPTREILDGALILAAGLLLITPGIITDVVGLSLLLPPLRRLFGLWLVGWFRRKTVVRFQAFGQQTFESGPEDVIDATFSRRDPETVDRIHIDTDPR